MMMTEIIGKRNAAVLPDPAPRPNRSNVKVVTSKVVDTLRGVHSTLSTAIEDILDAIACTTHCGGWVPVWAQAMMSWPEHRIGSACFCTGVGTTYLFSCAPFSFERLALSVEGLVLRI